MTSTSLSATEIRALLSHPDALVRSHADWALEARGLGWRGFTRSDDSTIAKSDAMITRRLAELKAAGLESSPHFNPHPVFCECDRCENGGAF